jgi:hypothetical protein
MESILHELIEEEILNAFPRQRVRIEHEEYELHCSPLFAKMLQMSFLGRNGVVIIGEVPKEAKFTSYRLPNVGLIRVIEDRKQGYEINRITPMLGEAEEDSSSNRSNPESRY